MIETKDKNGNDQDAASIPTEPRISKPHRKPEKFFFDQNNFDDDFEEEIIEEEPPPPMFSEEELAAAQQASYTKGKQAGLAESKASRDQHVATLLGQISANFQTLLTAESQRAAAYEAEALALAHAVFAKIFPALNKAHGLSEIEAIIREILDRQREQQEIIIHVHPGYVDPVEQSLENLKSTLPPGTGFAVQGLERLGPSDCELSWKEGGAHRHADALAEEIHSQLQHILADKATLGNNKESEPNDDRGETTDAKDITTETPHE